MNMHLGLLFPEASLSSSSFAQVKPNCSIHYIRPASVPGELERRLWSGVSKVDSTVAVCGAFKIGIPLINCLTPGLNS